MGTLCYLKLASSRLTSICNIDRNSKTEDMKGLLVCLSAFLALTLASATDVIFTVDPAQIDVNLTHTMKMACSLDSSVSVKHLVSIVITRLDKTGAPETVASVSTFDVSVPPAGVDQNKITIDNTSSIASTITGSYLKLEWDHPTIEQSRNYTCEINAIDMSSHPTKYLQNSENRGSCSPYPQP